MGIENNIENYSILLRQVKQRVALAQQRAIFAANASSVHKNTITQPPVAQLPEYNFSLPIRHIHWTHNVILMQRVKDIKARYWYMTQCLTSNWSKDYLIEAIKLDYYGKHGALANNFDTTLPAPEAKGVKSLLKDPYIFDMLTFTDEYNERDVEIGLVKHVEPDYELGQALPKDLRSSLPSIEDIEAEFDKK